ncbi:MAG: HAD hydrolase-like protein [Candidatus Pacebacteria bacterium]|nr:HAD hydrolase-like protein [Candidatus Paceibacterota bacterium]
MVKNNSLPDEIIYNIRLLNSIRIIMVKEIQSFAPQAEQLRQRRDSWLRMFDKDLRSKMSERQGFKSELPLTAHFLIDGSVKIPFAEFSQLPDWMKKFFLDDRVSRPPSVSVFSDYNDSLEHPEVLASVQNNTKDIVLRGGRFWDFDGSKANYGPDGAEAVELLFENINGNMSIINQLINFEPQNEFEWLARIAAWEYIRNDFCAVYYSLKCRIAKVDDASAHELGVIDHALEYISNRYFDSILMFQTDPHRGSRELSEIVNNAEEIKSTLSEFVSDPQFEGRDLLRSHREVNNPLSLMNAFRLIYKSDSDSNELSYTDEIKNNDAILAPLYGGIDLAYAFRYALGDGQRYIEQLLDTKLCDDKKFVKVLPVLSKLGSKGVVRSQLSKIDSVIPNLNSDESVNGREKGWLAKEIPDARSILVIDDSLATGGSAVVFKDWVSEALGHDVEMELRVIYANLRWSKHQCPIEDLMAADPITQTPITRSMKKALYPLGSRFMPDAVSNHLQQKTKRTFSSLTDAMPEITKMHQKKTIEAVGFDLDDTLILRTVDAKARRIMINHSILRLLNQNGITIDPDLYAERSYKILNRERGLSQTNPNHPIDMDSCNKEILIDLGITDKAQLKILAPLMTLEELKVDQKIVIPAPGAREILEELISLGIDFGIFSNSHYLVQHIEQILIAAGIDDLLIDRTLLTSANPGTPQKPDGQAIKNLAKEMGTIVQDLAYVGNSFQTDVVGSTKSGGVSIYIPQPVDAISRAEITKIKNWKEQLANV